MKKIIKLSYFLFLSLAVVSCSNDDDNAEVFTNTIEYDGDSFNVDFAGIFNYGSGEGYNARVFGLEGTLDDDTTIEFYAIFASEGEEAFRPGTFVYYDFEDEEEEYPEFFHVNANIYIESQDEYLDVVNGDIVISEIGEGYSYSISGVLTLENGQTVTISYSGAFEFVDDSQISKSTIKSSKLFKK